MGDWASIAPQLVTSLSAAAAAILGVILTSGGKMKNMLRQVEKLNSKLDAVYMDVLRLSFHDDKASIEERLDAGHKFVGLGGNGSTRADYEVFVEEYKGKSPLHNRRKGDIK
jgi:outer membrane murein-binding lipoprotein Lpp